MVQLVAQEISFLDSGSNPDRNNFLCQVFAVELTGECWGLGFGVWGLGFGVWEIGRASCRERV